MGYLDAFVDAVCYKAFLPPDSFNKVRGQNHYLRLTATQNLIPNITEIGNNCYLYCCILNDA